MELEIHSKKNQFSQWCRVGTLDWPDWSHGTRDVAKLCDYLLFHQLINSINRWIRPDLVDRIWNRSRSVVFFFQWNRVGTLDWPDWSHGTRDVAKLCDYLLFHQLINSMNSMNALIFFCYIFSTRNDVLRSESTEVAFSVNRRWILPNFSHRTRNVAKLCDHWLTRWIDDFWVSTTRNAKRCGLFFLSKKTFDENRNILQIWSHETHCCHIVAKNFQKKKN